ncbi:MAG: hypothetical protein QOJ15_9827 [Bradyrhizobium sp.]|nr:hypothetical protein [Bradyrhizobium sp.]
MLVTICRLYNSYADASRVVVALEAAGVAPSETSMISNNADNAHIIEIAETANAAPAHNDKAGSGAGGSRADGKFEGAAIGAAIGATAATAASLVRRGGTPVAARVPQAELPRVEAVMDRSAVELQERSDLYRKSGWQSFDPNAVPYSADQVRGERALHAH